MSRILRATFVVVISAVALTACSSGEEPPREPATTTAPSTSSPAATPEEALGIAEPMADEATCQTYVDGYQPFPDFNELPRQPDDPAVEDQIVEAATGWATVTRTISACAAEFGPLAGGDKALAQHAAALSLAEASSMGYAPPTGDPRITAEIDAAMATVLAVYPESCWAQLATGWQQEHLLDSKIGQACTKQP